MQIANIYSILKMQLCIILQVAEFSFSSCLRLLGLEFWCACRMGNKCKQKRAKHSEFSPHLNFLKAIDFQHCDFIVKYIIWELHVLWLFEYGERD